MKKHTCEEKGTKMINTAFPCKACEEGNKNKKNQTKTSSLSLKDIEEASWSNFQNMIDGVEYTFSEVIREKYNKEANKYGYYEPRQNEYQFKRNGLFFLYSYDFGKNFQKVKVQGENFTLALGSAFSLAFTLRAAFAFAFAANEIKKVNEDKDNKTSCNGKVVEIDGKKYKLTEVK